MLSPICGIYKTRKKNKTQRYREQTDSYQRWEVLGVAKNGKGGQLYGDGCS